MKNETCAVPQQISNPADGEPELKDGLGSHPWEIFLNARANVIDFLSAHHNNNEIADILRIDTIQVRIIKNRDRTLNDGA
jgi:hypothetical protein